MKSARLHQPEPHMEQPEIYPINGLAAQSFKTIAPFWPLKNLIAVNPLQGLEDKPIEEALTTGAAYFQQPDLPADMEAVNRETIKWLQVFFDEGQATIAMPGREKGLYSAWRQLALHDANLHGNNPQKRAWLETLPAMAEQAIAESLLRLCIAKEERALFATLMLTTLPGWSAHVKYRTEWAGLEARHPACRHPGGIIWLSGSSSPACFGRRQKNFLIGMSSRYRKQKQRLVRSQTSSGQNSITGGRCLKNWRSNRLARPIRRRRNLFSASMCVPNHSAGH